MSWVIRSDATDLETLLLEESLFFNGNGYLGVRGNLEEGFPEGETSIRGTYINGFYDDVPLTYGEKLHGFPDSQQKQLNIMDIQSVDLWVGENGNQEKVSLWTGEVLDYSRELDMKNGITVRKLHWRSSNGHELLVTFKRLASMTHPSLFMQYITLEPTNGTVPVTVVSRLEGDVVNHIDTTDPRVASGHAKRLLVWDASLTNSGMSTVEVETYTSGLRAKAASSIDIKLTGAESSSAVDATGITTTASFVLSETTTIDKRTFLTDSRKDSVSAEHQENLIDKPPEYFFEKQTAYMRDFWKTADIQIEGDDQLQEGIRFNMYHLLQSAGRDAQSNISAKGLSGEGYEGHYFWDTEIYMLPLFIMTQPNIAKNLLLYRYGILNGARQRAKEMGHTQGALFPWRTISGSECSAFFPAGSAQYHISADIAYSFVQYYLATGDTDFMIHYGTELLLETARLWMDTGHFDANGRFRVDAVTGPDEYTCVVNNNYYTNVMAKYNLDWAVKMAKLVKRKAPEEWSHLKQTLAFSESELVAFAEAAEHMYLPVDEALQINPQDDSFLQKGIWNLAATPDDQFPLLLHYHPLTLYRYQVCKQADTVLAHFLLEDEQSEEVMRNSYQYYEQVTTFDSSLSFCIFSMMAARFGNLDKAYHYFIDTVRMDLDNTHGNTKDGLHMANMGGTWLSIVSGFAGMRIKEDGLFFRPQLPEQWDRYTFHMQYQGRQLDIDVTGRFFKVTLLNGAPLSFNVWDQTYTAEQNKPVHIPIGTKTLSEK
ncbi:Alpha,alpha-trehalose phosphorylase [Lentibacillus sp. JNUCC-1]|uniref:glycoside hydrolase family 65 protein n=1 Tax=Lentibacillus sp. JNUCC-1 TaxID=2654513 RepID=UPI0012E72CB4|nr:glycosyl hydrolase family 65 protein [Lentibacillus sp. JNUCC-1]MUV36779.1 Alpha,alpha-trehalose phosphorylase [Lentibacillus sp. JNUCC-1]